MVMDSLISSFNRQMKNIDQKSSQKNEDFKKIEDIANDGFINTKH